MTNREQADELIEKFNREIAWGHDFAKRDKEGICVFDEDEDTLETFTDEEFIRYMSEKPINQA